MNTLTELKDKIRAIVGLYRATFPQEYRAAVRQIAAGRGAQDTKFSELKKSDFVERKLLEYPETLFAMLQNGLSGEEAKVFFGQERESRHITVWFAKEFPEFSAAQRI